MKQATVSPFIIASQSAGMSSSRLILCERTGCLAAGWLRLLATPLRNRRLEMTQVRSLQQCDLELAASPYSVAVVEVTSANLAAVQKRLMDWKRRFPRALFLAQAPSDLEPHELLLREAGASAMAFSTLSLPPLAKLVRRHLALTPRPEVSLTDSIWQRLPWPVA